MSDFRCVDQENVVNPGRNLVNAQEGVLLEITKKVAAKNLMANIFVISDANIVIAGARLSQVEY